MPSATEVKTSVEAITGHQEYPLPPLSTVAPPLRTTCYFNTPACMRDCFPSAATRVFTCRGELALDAEALKFTSTWRSTIAIPFKDIEDLSVGQFQMWTTPWVMKYARLSFLSIIFRREGQLQTVHLTPVEPGATSAGDINHGVGRWLERIREAAARCTGTVPGASDTASLIISAEPAWNRKALPLVIGCLLAAVGTWALHVGRVQGVVWFLAFLIVLLLIMGLGWFSFTFLQANKALARGALDSVTNDDPPVPEPADSGRARVADHRQAARWARTSYMTMSLFVLAVALLLMWASYRNRYAPPSRERPASPAAASGAALTPEPEGHFLLYTMPTLVAPGAPDHTNRLNWTFKCLVPAEHMARILFVRWSNGVPVVEIGGSAHYQVGRKSMDQDLYVSSEPFPDPSTHGPTNTVYWGLSLHDHKGTGMYVPRGPAYRRLDTPTRLTVRSGHQGIVRLVDYVTPEGLPTDGQPGIELRIFLEPMKYAPVRVDPFEVQGPDYVAGTGPGWTTDQALKAIKEWPLDK